MAEDQKPAPSAPTPIWQTIMMVQQGLLTAMLAARFDPALFPQKLAEVRGMMRLAALQDPNYDPAQSSDHDKAVEKILAGYQAIFRSGDTAASADDKPG